MAPIVLFAGLMVGKRPWARPRKISPSDSRRPAALVQMVGGTPTSRSSAYMLVGPTTRRMVAMPR